MATPKQQVRPTSQPSKATLRLPSVTSSFHSSTPVRKGRRRALIKPLLARGRDTLQGQFVVLALVLFVSSLVMMFVFVQLLQQTQDELHTIAIDSVPSVDAAQRMLQYLEDVDAKAADYIAAAALTDKSDCQIISTTRKIPNLTNHDCDALNIDTELTLANKELYKSIRNVTYPGERTALDRITAGLEEYNADVKISQHEYNLAGINFAPTNIHLINAKNAYYQATNVLNTKILKEPVHAATDETNVPACTINVRTPSGIVTRTLSAQAWPEGSLEENVACLTSLNKQHLDDAYNQTQNYLGYRLLWVLIMSIAFCALLFFTVWRVVRLTHYVIHFTLVLVTLASIVFCGLVTANFFNLYGQQGEFKVMVKDAYDSVYYAAQLQQYGTAANADESRWLIAVTFNDQDQINRWQQDWYSNRAEVGKLILQAKANRTWPEEDQPLATMQLHWKNYTAIDPQIRALATDTAQSPYNRIQNAQKLSTGHSNDEFYLFLSAVANSDSVANPNAPANLSDTNRGYFNRTYASANGFLTGYVFWCYVLFLVVGILASGSVLRRTRDF